ncbi:MAG: hypothetical protein BA871_12935 [Desulfuromonadales bacterium C00003096]|jgi:curved DNA-binding protein CbpA|nr:MAG: hypothetical protein BA871_12935 [Desulfuromonadales bacterium C00003096]
MVKTCYQILAVPFDSSSAEIQRAFRRQARRCHPDTAPPGAADAARFQELLVAYRLLNSPSKRAHYDAQMAASRSAVSGSLLGSWRKLWRLRWQWLMTFFRRSANSSPVREASTPCRPPDRVRTRNRERSCWPTFGEVLAVRQKAESSCYVLCEDGIIRPKSAVGESRLGESRPGRPLRSQRPNLTVVLRGWWGGLLMLMIGCWEVFRR